MDRDPYMLQLFYTAVLKTLTLKEMKLQNEKQLRIENSILNRERKKNVC